MDTPTPTWDSILTELIEILRYQRLHDMPMELALVRVISHLEEKYEAPALKK